ncbi:MAG: amidohydrolase, partial [Gemmatimonadales bacterium]|nr:amidohydrolase [Gemmatimonadales bacterium]
MCDSRPDTVLGARPAPAGTRLAPIGVLTLLGLALAEPGAAALPQEGDAARAWDVTAPLGETREVDFTTDEGTWMSIDLEPGGEWLVFDLLGHIYRLPAEGGEAEVLTQNTGVAVNYHPTLSPDGSTIAFISDRGGQSNLWLMDADGSNPRPVFEDQGLRAWEPAWSPDGRFIVVRRASTRRGGGGAEPGLWMYA